MRARGGVLVAVAIVLTACSNTGNKQPKAVDEYNGTTAAGDFVTLAVDHDASTIAWDNQTDAHSGVASYSVDTDGALIVTDSLAFVKKAYEVPGFALVAEYSEAGPALQSPLFAWHAATATASAFRDMTVSSFQYRATGTLEVNCGSVSAAGDELTLSSFAPDRLLSGSSAFAASSTVALAGTLPSPVPNDYSAIVLTDRSDGTVAFAPYKQGQLDTEGVMFRAGEGWAIAIPNAAIFYLDAPASPAWQSSKAGDYMLVGWETKDLTAGSPGTSSFVGHTFTLDADGGLSFDDMGTPVSMTLAPFSQDADLHGPALVDQPCNGLFTSGPQNQKLFVGFIGQALFLSAASTSQVGEVETQKYLYGVGLKLP